MMVPDWIRRLREQFGRRPVAPTSSEPEWVALPTTPEVPAAVHSTEPRIGFAAGRSGHTPADLARERLSSAFHPSVPTREIDLFAGREEALATLIQALEVQKLHVVVYGDRGLGKTSLLNIMSHLARDAGYLVSHAACGSDSDFDSVFRQVAASVPLRHHASADPATVASGDTLASLLGEAPLDVPRAAELLGGVRGVRLLILLDEFDRASSDQFRLQVAELVKALSDGGASVQLVIAGVASNLNALIRHIPSIRRNIIGLPLGPMRDEELRAIVARGAERSGLTFEDEAADRLVTACNGSPYLANLLGQHAGLAATARGRTDVTVRDAGAAVSRATEELRLRLTAATLARIHQLSEADLVELVGAAAVAMREVGQVDAERLPRPERFGALLEPLEGEDDTVLRFAEESAVPFLWLLHLSRPERDPPRMAAVES